LDCASAQAFTGAAFEKDVIGHDAGGATVLLQDGENTVLGKRWLDGQAREVAGKRREVANQHVLQEVKLQCRCGSHLLVLAKKSAQSLF